MYSTGDVHLQVIHIASQAATNLSAYGDLLARSVAARITGHAADLSRAATALVETLPDDPGHVRRSATPGDGSLPVEPGFLVDLLTALGQIDVALADRAVDCILAWPQTYEPDAVLVPAVLGLSGPAAHQAAAAVAAPAHGSPGAPARPYRRTAGATTRLGTGPALSRARVRIAANSAASWRIPTASVGRLRPLKPGAVTWRSRSSGAAATWTW